MLPKWIVSLVPGGRIIITPSDGSEFTEEDLTTVKQLCVNHHRSLSMAGEKDSLRDHDGKGLTNGGVEFDIDPAVMFLCAYRRKRRMTVASIGRLIFTQSSRITSYESGKARPFMDTLRAWAATVGFRIMLVPVAHAMKVAQETDRYLEEQFQKDLEAWGGNPPRLWTGKNNADLSPESELQALRYHAGPPAPGQAATGSVSDPERASGSDGGLEEPSSHGDVDGV